MARDLLSLPDRKKRDLFAEVGIERDLEREQRIREERAAQNPPPPETGDPRTRSSSFFQSDPRIPRETDQAKLDAVSDASRAVRAQEHQDNLAALQRGEGTLTSRVFGDPESYGGRAALKLGQTGGQIFSGLARLGIAAGDLGQDIFGEMPGDDWARETLTDLAQRGELVAAAPIEGAPTWEETKENPWQYPSLIAHELPGALAYSGMMASGLGVSTVGGSFAGNIAQERALNNDRLEADARDVAIAAPFAAGSVALERLGSKYLFGGGELTGGVATRIAKSAAAEGATEAGQSLIEGIGEQIGTDKGLQAGDLADRTFAGAAIGFGTGGAIRGGTESFSTGVDATGRLLRRDPNDTRPATIGMIEEATSRAAQPTQADIDSPLDTGDILKGRATIAGAEAKSAVAGAIDGRGLPPIGQRVAVNDPQAGTVIGTVSDYSDEGIVITPEGGGTPIREYFDTLAELGITITPALDSDAQLAAAAQAALADQPNYSPRNAPNSAGVAPSPRSQAATTPAVQGDGATTFDLESYLNRNSVIESNNQPYVKAGTSSASGLFQFTKSTWIGEGGQWGNDPSQAFGGLKPSLEEQRERARSLTQKNVTAIQQAGAPLTDGNVYLAHFLGAGTAAKVLGADRATPVSQLLGSDQIAANKSILEGKTAGDVIDWAAGKMGDAAPTGGPSTDTGPDYEGVGGRSRARDAVETSDIGEGRSREAVQTDLLGGPERTESELAARETLDAVIEEATSQAEESGSEIDLRAVVQGLRQGRRNLVADSNRAPGASISDYEGAPESTPQAFIEAADANPAFIEALAERAGLSEQAATAPSAQAEERIRPSEVSSTPASVEESSTVEDSSTANLTFEPSPSGKGLTITGLSDAQVELLKSTVPKAKPGPRRKRDGAITYSKKHEAAIRAALAQDAPSAKSEVEKATADSMVARANEFDLSKIKGGNYRIVKGREAYNLERDGNLIQTLAPSDSSAEIVQKAVRSALKTAQKDASSRATVEQSSQVQSSNQDVLQAAKDSGRLEIVDTRRNQSDSKPDEKGRTQIGTNRDGDALFEDQNGVRSFVRRGVRVTESVEITPGRAPGINPDSRGGEFLTEAERAQTDTAVPEAGGVETNSEATQVGEGRVAATDSAGSPASAVTNQTQSGLVESKDATQGEGGARAPSPNRLVTDDRAAELRARLKEKLNPSRLNSGIDPEVLAIGAELAVFHIEKGARRFIAVSRRIAADLDMSPASLKKYLRGWYNGARDMMEDSDVSVEGMDDADTVRAMIQSVDEWGGEILSATDEAKAGITVGDADVSDRLRQRDGDTSTQDAARDAQDGGSERAFGQEGEGSARPVRDADQRPADAAQRGAQEPAGRSRSTRAGVRDNDGVPAAGRAGSGRDGGRRDSSNSVTAQDWTIEPGSLDEGRSPMQKARDNLSAVETVKQIEAEARPATRAEQSAIAKYVGWGGLKPAFPDSAGKFGKGFEEIGPRLRELLTDEEYRTAQQSIQYAHYTGETIVRSMWDIAQRLGFKGGQVFEPGMGTGNFVGMMPASLKKASRYSGIEFDGLTASIAKALYPKSGVRQDDYTSMVGARDAFDLVIGNPPFSETTVGADPEYRTKKFVLHDFFFAKSLDAVKPGGLLMFVTSAGTMNKVNTKAREYMADRADLVGAIRLPGNAFEQNAGTKVTTDIVVLRKRKEGEQAGDRSWVKTSSMTLPSRDGGTMEGNVSSYFEQNPDMILGEQGFFDELVAGPRYGVRAPQGFDLDAALSDAVGRLPQDIIDTAPTGQSPAAEAIIDAATTETKDGSFYVGEGGKLMQLRRGVGVEVQAPGKGVKGGISKANQQKIKQLVPIRDALREVYAADLAQDSKAGDAARAKLNKTYDAFVKEHGPLNKTNITYRSPSRVQIEGARLQAREDARLAGQVWDDGSFDLDPYLDRGDRIADIARAREEAREQAKAQGKAWNEGTFDPNDVPETVIEKKPNLDAFTDDQESYRLAAIERYSKETGEAVKGQVFFENAVKLDRKPEINSAGDALLYSLNRFGSPNIGFIAEETGRSQEDVLEELGDKIFEVPGSPGVYETSEGYLSGNVRAKLATAEEAARTDDRYSRNVAALRKALPVDLTPAEITANLGMPWIPPEVVQQFARDKMGLAGSEVTYTSIVAKWRTAGNRKSRAAIQEWGTDRIDAVTLLGQVLNRSQIKVTNTIETESGKRTIVDEVATEAAQEKAKAMKQAFRDWIWSEEGRTDELVRFYNDRFNNLVAPKFSGDFLTTPGINSSWQWRPHQRQVVARVIQSGNTYMAHEVGAGKTSAMIGAGMEMRRLGQWNKPMYVVPNHMLGQFTQEFYEQYPLAKILVADEKRFHTSRRKEFIAEAAANDLDAIIITHSAFGFIPLSAQRMGGFIQSQIDELSGFLSTQKKDSGGDRFTRRQVEQQKEQLEQQLKGLQKKKDEVFTFEEMGVDALIVDEAHLFRKLNFMTGMGSTKGIDPNGSKMSLDLFAKTQYLEEEVNPGRGIVFASGTPVTNTMAELFSVSRYLQNDTLKERGLDKFDAWAGAFGDTSTTLEQGPDGNYKPQTRFTEFVNAVELSVMVRQVMDVVTANDLRQYVTLPELKGGKRKMVLAEQTADQQAYQAVLASRMQAIEKRTGQPKPGDDILLSVIGDGRKSAIDYRLIDPTADRDPGSKLEQLIENVAERHKEFDKTEFRTPGKPGEGYSKDVAMRGPATQMIFSDLGINGDFPVHKYMKRELVRRGIPEKQIALISDFKTTVAKQRLFNDMNEGKVRVLIGSVPKMGTGVNAQKRLRALHNLDAQWYPANDTQRNGRIMRQGNMNPEIEILDYSTKGTYDSQMWQLMAKKAKFIEAFMRGDPDMRTIEDLGEASQYEQAQALTTSDPRIMEMTEWKQERERLERQRIAAQRAAQTQRIEAQYARSLAEEARGKLAIYEAAQAQVDLPASDAFTGQVGQSTFDDATKYGEALLAAMDSEANAFEGKEPRERVVARLGGIDISAKTMKVFGSIEQELLLNLPQDMQLEVKYSEDPRGTVTRITNAIKGIEGRVVKTRESIAANEARADEFENAKTEAFEGDARIEELAGKIDAMEATLKSESDAREAAAKGQKESRVDPEDLRAVQRDFDAEELRQRLDDLGLRKKVAVNLVDTLGGPAGRYTPGQKRLIEVALDTEQDQSFTLDHEAIHAMREMDLFKPSEWSILTARAKRETGLLRSIKKRYPSLDAEAQVEEAVADMFARHQRGDYKARGVVDRVLKTLSGVMEALRNAFSGRGLKTAESVMQITVEGHIGARDAVEGGEGQEHFSIPEREEAVILAGQDPTWRGKMERGFNAFRRAAQDRYLPLLRVQRDIELRNGPLPENLNPYLAEELSAGRIGSRLDELFDERVRPLFDAMAEEKVTTDELETYLYARHAPERNARIAEINPEFTEGSGSGMTDLEARAVMSRIEREGKTDAMKRLAKHVDRMRDEAVDRRVESGLMSKTEAEEWRSTYKHYVPLRGFKETDGHPDDVTRINRSGGGINVRGKESRAAYGRRSEADSPLAYTILQAEEAIVRGETNRVAQRFYDLAKANRDSEFWAINKPTYKRRTNPDTGLVESYVVHQLTAEDKDWTVVAKFDGREHRVTMNRANPDARALADAMRNITQHQLDWVTKYLGVVNRFLSRVNTSYNPEFIISNAVRDIQTAAANVSAEEVEGLTSGTLKDYRKALVASTKGAWGNMEGEWGQIYRDFIKDGGRVYFNQVEDVGLIKKRITRVAEQVQAAKGDGDLRLQAKRYFRAAIDAVENTNLGVENAVRLAAYKNARELGMTREKAASLAKNLTVNFNRRGTFGPTMNALYLFFNASIQGSVRMFQAMKSRRLQKILGGVVVGSAVLELLNAMVSGDDEDGESFYDKIPEYEKRRNMIIMLPGGSDYIKIPLPYGYNVFSDVGRALANTARNGGENWLENAGGVLTSALESFNPVGFDFEGRSGWEAFVSLAAPSAIDPIVDLSQNRDFTGRPIMPEQMPFGVPEPEHQRYFAGTGPHWQAVSKFLNNATGGDDVVEGAVSVSPAAIEHLFGTVVGAAGSFVDRTLSVPGKIADPEFDFDVSDVPFARKAFGTAPRWYDKGAYYERIGTIEQAVRDTKDYLEREQFDSAAQYAEANAIVLSLEPAYKAAEREMRKIRKARRANQGAYERGQIDKATYDRERALVNDAEDVVITRFNTIWNDTVGKKREFGAAQQ